MTKIKVTIAALLLVPLLAFGANLGATAGSQASSGTSPVQFTGTSYECCWVFHNGRWYCIPC